jgi:hypothetical protein
MAEAERDRSGEIMFPAASHRTPTLSTVETLRNDTSLAGAAYSQK